MTPEGRMDPLTEAKEKLLKSRTKLLKRIAGFSGGVSWSEVVTQKVDLTVRELNALLASPVPSPSADARAKLEQVRDYIQKAMSSGGVKALVNENSYERGHRSGLQHALNAIDHELSALPPHEGETPQEVQREEHTEVRCPKCEHPFNVLVLTPRNQRFLLDMIGEGETPQPAAEPSGWRDIASAPKDGTNVLLGWPTMVMSGYWADWRGRKSWVTARGEYHGEHAPTHWMPLPLPPVVQTRPEEPR